MKFQEISPNTPDDEFIFIECDITGKTKKTRYGAAKANVARNNGQYITNWGLAKLNNPMSRQDVKEKVKQTNLERYGATTALNLPENLEKRKALFEDAEFVKKRTEKHKQTCIEKYGVEHHMHTDELKEKVKNKNLEKYGTVAPLQNPEILAKAQATNLERYGDVCSLNNPDVKAKALKSLFEHYGVEYYNQLPEMKDYLRENCTTWLAESYANPWAKGVPKTDEQRQKQSETVMDLIGEGNWNVGAKYSIKGIYTISKKCRRNNPIFRSSYELKTHYHLDNDDTVEWYDYEPFKVQYVDAEGKKRNYAIDFVVKYNNRDKLIAVEVKNDYDMKRFKECGKEAAFINECSQYIDLEIWSNEKIKSLNLDLEELLKML
jgi:hypothetical protein